MEDKSLFFIAILPPEKVSIKITQLKIKFSRAFETNHSFRSPPHITLIPPFRITISEQKEVDAVLAKFCIELKKFILIVKGFNAFAPRVIYLKIEESPELSAIRTNLMKHVQFVETGMHFIPHITLASRDLSKSMFHRAWSIYRHETFVEEFVVSSLALLKHNGKFWDIYREYPFRVE